MKLNKKLENFVIIINDCKLPIYSKPEFIKGKTMNEILSVLNIKKIYTLAIRTPTFIKHTDENTVITDKFSNLIHNKKYDFSYALQYIPVEEISDIQLIFKCKVDNKYPNSDKQIQMPNFIVKFRLNEFENKPGNEILAKITSNFGFQIENPQIYINDNLIDVNYTKSDDIFDQLLNDKNNNIFQCHLTEKTLKLIDRRITPIKELVESETIYLERLNYIYNIFKFRMKAANIFNENKEKFRLFNESIKKIFKYHTNFYIFGLKKLKIEYSDVVSKSFLRLGDSFSINQDYIHQYGVLIALMSEIEKNERIQKVNTSFFNHEKINIEDVTQIPSQRLLKYLSLIKEIKKFTPKSHIDHDFLRIVETKMKKIISQVDSFVDKSKNYIEMNNIMKRINDANHFLSSNKNLSLKSFFNVVISSKNKSIENKQGVLYLFHDQIILTLKNEKENILFANKIKKQSFVLFPMNKIDSILFFTEFDDFLITTFERKEAKIKFISDFQNIRSNLIHYKTNQLYAEEIATKMPNSVNLSGASLTRNLAVFTGGRTDRTTDNRSPIITFDCKGNKISILSDANSLIPDSAMKMAHGSERMSLYAFGGLKTRSIMSYKDKKWINLPGEATFTRTNHSFVFYKNYLVVFGGNDELNKESNELWMYDMKDNSWIKPVIESVCPPARFDHSAAVYKDTMIIHGGQFNGEKLNDIWEFDFLKMKWKQITIENNRNIVHRSGHSALIINQFMVVLGGEEKEDLPFAFDIERCNIIQLKIAGNYICGMNHFGSAFVINEKQILCLGGFNYDKSIILNSFTKITLPDEITNV